mgnify:FL=1
MGKPFIILEAQGNTCTRVHFLGTFQGREVIWDATLMTLEHHSHKLHRTGAEIAVHRPFIEIGESAGNSIPLSVALDVSVIDKPVILKTIIMIRNYRRLHEGRHEFGERRIFRFSQEQNR